MAESVTYVRLGGGARFDAGRPWKASLGEATLQVEGFADATPKYEASDRIRSAISPDIGALEGLTSGTGEVVMLGEFHFGRIESTEYPQGIYPSIWTHEYIADQESILRSHASSYHINDASGKIVFDLSNGGTDGIPFLDGKAHDHPLGIHPISADQAGFTATGGRRDDTISGSNGADRLSGGGGDDDIQSGTYDADKEADILSGGTGSDKFRIYYAASHLGQVDRITDFDLGDSISFMGGSEYPKSNGVISVGDGKQVGAREVEAQIGASFTMLHFGLDAKPGSDARIRLDGDFRDRGFVMDGAAIVLGRELFTSKRDEVTFDALDPGQAKSAKKPGANLYDAQEGNDKVALPNGGTIAGTVAFATTAERRFLGGKGDDEITGGRKGDFIDGGDGDDIVRGGLGKDDLVGGSDDDELFGDEGDDLLNGVAVRERGENLLDGGEGSDTINYSGNRDLYTFKRFRPGDNPANYSTFDVQVSNQSGGVDSWVNWEAWKFADQRTMTLQDVYKFGVAEWAVFWAKDLVDRYFETEHRPDFGNLDILIGYAGSILSVVSEARLTQAGHATYRNMFVNIVEKMTDPIVTKAAARLKDYAERLPWPLEEAVDRAIDDGVTEFRTILRSTTSKAYDEAQKGLLPLSEKAGAGRFGEIYLEIEKKVYETFSARNPGPAPIKSIDKPVIDWEVPEKDPPLKLPPKAEVPAPQRGTPGDDTIRLTEDGMNRPALLFLGAGNDRATTGRGHDLITAGVGDDIVSSGAGNDVLVGGGGNDRLYASAGSDAIQGGAGDDRMYGGSGRDSLDGGAGSNRLTGGGDADRFVFSFVPKPGDRASETVILDFGAGDRIDLSRLDAVPGRSKDQPFDFVGSDRFSGKSGELRFADGKLLADLDGDRTSDFAIGITAVRSIQEDHLIL